MKKKPSKTLQATSNKVHMQSCKKVELITIIICCTCIGNSVDSLLIYIIHIHVYLEIYRSNWFTLLHDTHARIRRRVLPRVIFKLIKSKVVKLPKIALADTPPPPRPCTVATPPPPPARQTKISVGNPHPRKISAHVIRYIYIVMKRWDYNRPISSFWQ